MGASAGTISSRDHPLGGEARLRTGAGRDRRRPDETTAPLVDSVLRPLWAAHEALKRARARSPLDLDIPERKLVLDSGRAARSVTMPERLAAHRLIEEFMILANVAAAETLEDHSPLIYRAHDAPSAEKSRDLSSFLGSIGVKLAKGDNSDRRISTARSPGEGEASRRWSTRWCCAPRRRPNTARELRPFRPEPAPLRALHVPDPPLCRSHCPSGSDPSARTWRRRRAI